MTDDSSKSRLYGMPTISEIHAVNQSFNFRERVVLFVIVVIAASSLLGFLWQANSYALTEVPASGGILTEGILGTPRFINPILAISDADRDLSSLIYSGLLRVNSDGGLENDLAEKYEISGDGRIYTFTIKEDAFWHDGEPVTADDVIFTIEKTNDPGIKSPRRANWEGVETRKLGTKKIEFILKQPYGSFLENAAMGIIPKHRWQAFDSESFPFSPLNTKPVGSGLYQVYKIKEDGNGIPVYYELRPFDKAAAIKPKVSLRVYFYNKSDDLVSDYQAGKIDGLSVLSPEKADELKINGARVETAPLPRVFGVFFNQSLAPIFTHKEVRQALNMAAPKKKIVAEILHGYGEIIDGPFPPGSLGYEKDEKIISDNTAAAAELLEKEGWKLSEDGVRIRKTKTGVETLSFTMDTSNVPELKAVTELLKSEWGKIGVLIKTKYYDEDELKNIVIRPRKYEALLFGEVMGRNPDPFSFWHSSQRLDPGLNIAMYTNAAVDRLLSEARALSDRNARLEKFNQFKDEITADRPAVFLYSPSFIYAVPEQLKGLSLPPVIIPSDRFSNVNQWHLKTDKVWKIFSNYYN